MKKTVTFFMFCFLLSVNPAIYSQYEMPASQFDPLAIINTSADFQAAPVVKWEQHYASGKAPGYDVVMDMIIDGSGNVYVTGYSTTGHFGTDFYTVKYNTAGVEVWHERYNGAANGDDVASAIFLDIKGNIYVTGFSNGSTANEDFITIKYDKSGNQQWVARYNGSGNTSDWAEAVAVDVSGNIYVTGTSRGIVTDGDMVTVKYNASGIQQWVNAYNGPGNLDDQATAIGIDKAGNVFVTGASEGSGTSNDFVTLKYNPDGVIQWTMRYDGPGKDLDMPRTLFVDGSGNIYVTGFSEGSGTGHDFATIKYNNSDGAELWVARYNRSGNSSEEGVDLAVDRLGNVYVTGKSKGSDTDWDYATVMYNSSGAERWVSRFNGPNNQGDYPSAIDIDDTGNIYVTGESYDPTPGRDFVTVKYNNSGAEQWVRRYNGPGNLADTPVALRADGAGNVYISGKSTESGTDMDYATVKYSTAGVELWVTRYDGPGNSNDYAAAMTIDAAGNVYVTGKSLISDSDFDFTTIKYAPDGTVLWANRHKGIVDGEDYATAICVDSEGNVYVTGVTESTDTGFDYLTIKYNVSGSEQWAVRYNGPDNSNDEAEAIGVDGFGNIYVTGTSRYTDTGFDVVTIKYNPNSNQQWLARYSGNGTATDIAKDIAVDRLGNVYVCGTTGSPSNFLTIKYNIFGAQKWAQTYDGPAQATDGAEAIEFDPLGNVYVTGYSIGSNTSYDCATIKYNSGGAEQWVKRYDASGTWDRAYALAMDDSANVYITGVSAKNPGQDGDYLTIKYSTEGSTRWIRRFDGVGSTHDEAMDIAVDGLGNAYVTGWNSKEYLAKDVTTVKYDAAGKLGWAARYPGLGNTYDTAHSIAVDDSGNVYIAGTSEGYAWSVFTTIKYGQKPLSVSDGEIHQPDRFHLEPNYPNPFNGKTAISFQISAFSPVELTIHNIRGQKVATLMNDTKSAGTYRVFWDGTDEFGQPMASGIYIYRLKTDHQLASIKMLLLR